MSSCTKLVATLAVGLMASTLAVADVYVPDFGSSTGALSTASKPISIGFDVNFYGTTYSEVYIHDKGFISFDAEATVVIASFFVETSSYNIGSYYDDYGNLSEEYRNYKQAAYFDTWRTFSDPAYSDYDALNISFMGQGVVRDTTCISHCVWGEYTVDDNHFFRDSYITLIDRSDTGVGNFDILFLDPGSISGADSFSGYGVDGKYYGFNNSLLFNTYALEVRNGVVTNPLPLLAVPEPETWVMLLAGIGIVGMVTCSRRIKK